MGDGITGITSASTLTLPLRQCRLSGSYEDARTGARKVKKRETMSDESKLSSYLFFVEIDGIETARFQKCEGLEAESSVFEYE